VLGYLNSLPNFFGFFRGESNLPNCGFKLKCVCYVLWAAIAVGELQLLVANKANWANGIAFCLSARKWALGMCRNNLVGGFALIYELGGVNKNNKNKQLKTLLFFSFQRIFLCCDLIINKISFRKKNQFKIVIYLFCFMHK